MALNDGLECKAPTTFRLRDQVIRLLQHSAIRDFATTNCVAKAILAPMQPRFRVHNIPCVRRFSRCRAVHLSASGSRNAEIRAKVLRLSSPLGEYYIYLQLG